MYASMKQLGTLWVCVLMVPPGSTNHGSHMDWKMGKHFPVREKSGNFEQTRKVREFYPENGKSGGILASFYFDFFLLLLSARTAMCSIERD